MICQLESQIRIEIAVTTWQLGTPGTSSFTPAGHRKGTRNEILVLGGVGPQMKSIKSSQGSASSGICVSASCNNQFQHQRLVAGPARQPPPGENQAFRRQTRLGCLQLGQPTAGTRSRAQSCKPLLLGKTTLNTAVKPVSRQESGLCLTAQW